MKITLEWDVSPPLPKAVEDLLIEAFARLIASGVPVQTLGYLANNAFQQAVILNSTSETLQ